MMITLCNHCDASHQRTTSVTATSSWPSSHHRMMEVESGAVRLNRQRVGPPNRRSPKCSESIESAELMEASEISEKCIICRSDCGCVARCEGVENKSGEEKEHQKNQGKEVFEGSGRDHSVEKAEEGEEKNNRKRPSMPGNRTKVSGAPPERCRGTSRSLPVSSLLDWPISSEDRGRSREDDRDKKRFNMPMLLVAGLLMFWSVGASVFVGASEIRADMNMTAAQERGVCQSIDIRNTPEELIKLKDCRVIEGFLQILLIDESLPDSYENHTFPLLTEITDFLLVFRVKGLKSIGRLFPNLSVIRGRVLFNNYALVVYEMLDLEEIGLKSLSFVGRGAVRLEKNTALCFAEAIDWTKIVNGTQHEANYIYRNRKENECPVCPGGNSSEAKNCPVMHSTPYSKKKFLCWNVNHCQHVCPVQCEWNCDALGNCCDPSCLGGCSVGNPRNCTACRHFSLGDRPDRKCIEKCPPHYYEHVGRRCITKQECLAIRKPIQLALDEPMKPYIPFDGQCRLNCPQFYEMDTDRRMCNRCPNDQCKKVCGGAKIDSIAAAQKMSHCNIVRGTLEIQIRREGGLSIVNELGTFLSEIEEIEGQLKIARSDPFVSLNFFKNLKVIKGVSVDGVPLETSFTLMENENLQDLFNENQTVRILNGQLNFHTNPKLCLNKIARLAPMVSKNVRFNMSDFAKNSNGDRAACNVTKLEVRDVKTYSRAATVNWDPVVMEDERSLLGYVIFYKQAPFQNVTLLDGRDACGYDGWHNDDIRVDKRPFYLFTHLEPYTQYAFYVKTVQIVAEKTGAESEIYYFTTEPSEPDIVRNAKVKESKSHEMTIAWDAPRKANGNLTVYIIKANLTTDNERLLNQRDYCLTQWESPREQQPPPTPHPVPAVPDKVSPMDCECGEKESKIQKPTEAEYNIQFEDALHNYVYVKRPEPKPSDQKRRRRSPDYEAMTVAGNKNSTVEDIHRFPTDLGVAVTPYAPRESVKNGSYYTYIYKEVAVPTTSVQILELRHSTLYTISIMACRSGPAELNCSKEAILSHRTAARESANDIKDIKINGNPKNGSHNLLALTWTPPPNPNGPILSYTIKYTNKDIENGIGQLTCITAKDFEANNRIYNLKLGAENGNYSVEVQVLSLAGPGSYSNPIFYRIENPNYTIWIALGVTSIMLLLLSGLVYYFYQNKKKEKDHRLFAEVNPDYDTTPYVPDEYEIPRERVKRNKELGQGSFGMVYAGAVQLKEDDPTETQCAIKTVNDSATERERMNFLKEAHVMKEFHTPHVVQLLGVVSKGDPPLVVMELMALGDLKGYLRAHRPDADVGRDGEAPVPPSVRQILQMATEIADGMAYLAHKKFVHRDLAARNCMVAEDLTVKIGDFGMTRDIYETDYYRKGDKGLLPVRWMSPESLKDGVFTTSNDVFSYGVVLWEMATLASQPYQGLTNDQVLRYVIDGGVMERPENCPDKLYQLMRRCWEHRPSNRPTFLDIVAFLLDVPVNAVFYGSSFYFSDEGEAHRYILQQNAENHHPDEGTTLLRPENEMSHDNARENWEMPNNNNNSRRLLEEGGAMPIIKPAQSPLRFLTGKSGNDYKESKF